MILISQQSGFVLHSSLYQLVDEGLTQSSRRKDTTSKLLRVNILGSSQNDYCPFNCEDPSNIIDAAIVSHLCERPRRGIGVVIGDSNSPVLEVFIPSLPRDRRSVLPISSAHGL